MGLDDEAAAVGVDQCVTLAPVDLFARIVTASKRLSTELACSTAHARTGSAMPLMLLMGAARMSSVPSCSCSLHWRDEPQGSRRNVCPQKHKQDSHDYIARRPCDVRRLRPALPLVVRLQGHVAHDV